MTDPAMTMSSAPNQEDIPHIVADRKRYDAILYTPLKEAHEELERRRRDTQLGKRVMELLRGNIPVPLAEKPKGVIFRNVMSPNYELQRFEELMSDFGKLEPLYWEHRADKFTSNNELKRMLGKPYFYNGRGKKNGAKVDSLNIIDFVSSDGKCISSIKTLWGQDLVDFHHELFDTHHRELSRTFFDSSPWLQSHGKSAERYYRAFLALFIRDGILFENAMLDETEIAFTSQIFLPAFLSLQREFGVKPLIVALAPTDEEHDRHWMCYRGSDRHFVEKKMQITRRLAPHERIQKSFLVRDTGVYGKGVFATGTIAEGETIHVLTGEVMHIGDFIERVNADQENIDDPLQVGKRTYLDLDELSRTFNHSCHPNAALRGRSELCALREILPGEEISYDYSMTIAPTDWKMTCVCGAENCRKTLGDVLSVPKATRTRYRELGAVQTYIRKLLDALERGEKYRMPAYELKLLKDLKKTSNL